jgi:hypothetical protein
LKHPDRYDIDRICDLDLVTERRGNPHTLHCTKNQASAQPGMHRASGLGQATATAGQGAVRWPQPQGFEVSFCLDA